MSHFTTSKNKRPFLRLHTLIPAFLFLLSIFVSILTTYYASEHFLDGDASSELVLAHHLAETGQTLSSDWYYSTELRVINTQLIYAPLFHIFSDWHMVRFTGALIMQALLVASFGYLCRQSKLSLGAFFLGSSLLLSPTSIAYGRIVLYHCYYMPHIILGFLIIGLYLSACQVQHHTLAATVSILLMALLSFGSGLGGVRQAIITQIPLLLIVIYRIIRDTRVPLSTAFKRSFGKLILSLLCLICFFLGFIVNSNVLSQQYHFSDYTQIQYDILNIQKLPSLLYGLLHQFGFRQNLQVISVLGIITLGSFLIFLYCIVRSFYCLSINPEHVLFGKQICSLFFISSLLVSLFIFIFLKSEWYFPLYFIPVAVWTIPFLSVQYDQLALSDVCIRRTDAALLLTLVCYIPSVAANFCYFNDCTDTLEQPYEGLSFQNQNLVEQLSEAADWLLEHDYTLGYATFWNSNTITEMTDGQVQMINVEPDSTNQALLPYKWLTQPSLLDKECSKPFLLLRYDECMLPAAQAFISAGTLVSETNGYYMIYDIDPAVLPTLLHMQ